MKTATTPGNARAASASIRRIRACASGLRRNAAWSIPGQDDVVDVPAGAGEDPAVLDAQDALADEPSGRGPHAAGANRRLLHVGRAQASPSSASSRPASRTPSTMLV